MVLELSNYYLDVAKDRLYVRGAASADRRQVPVPNHLVRCAGKEDSLCCSLHVTCRRVCSRLDACE